MNKLGKQEGIQQGISEGEIKAQIEIAKKLIKAGTETNFIAEITGLKVNEIIEFKNLI